jgi:uncharacterized protein with GYD domain
VFCCCFWDLFSYLLAKPLASKQGLPFHRYLVRAVLTAEGLKNLQKQPPTALKAGVAKFVESVGGKLEFWFFDYGAATAYSVIDYPDEIAAATAAQIAGTIDKLARESNAGLIVLPGAQFTTAKELIIATAARLRLPAMYPYTYWVKSGGLISYGFDAQDMYRRAASYVDRILRGARVQELPVQNPVKFELAINLKTAKALGLEVPPTLLARADEVIE